MTTNKRQAKRDRKAGKEPAEYQRKEKNDTLHMPAMVQAALLAQIILRKRQRAAQKTSEGEELKNE